VEWVEITAPTIEEARDRVLDRLGVDASDAEIEILEEAGTALFGLRRKDARVRARVRPTAPPPRQDRNSRRRSSNRSRSQKPGSASSAAGGRADKGNRSSETGNSSARRGNRKQEQSRTKSGSEQGRAPSSASGSEAAARTDRQTGTRRKSKTRSKEQRQEKNVIDEISLEDQGAMIVEFLDGLVEAFELSATAEVILTTDDAIEVSVNGDDLGLLIGPGGNTLSALGEVTKTVLQRRSSGSSRARVRLDVAGYRERRRSALAAFTLEVASSVKESGESRALEPMHSADRKVVHDTVTDVDGVGTISDGEEPRRRVVLVPEG